MFLSFNEYIIFICVWLCVFITWYRHLQCRIQMYISHLNPHKINKCEGTCRDQNCSRHLSPIVLMPSFYLMFYDIYDSRLTRNTV